MVKIPKENPEMIEVDYAGKILGREELEEVARTVNKMAREDFYGAKVLGRNIEVGANNGDLVYTSINGTILVGQVVRDMFPGVGIANRAQKERAYENGLSWEDVYSYDSLSVGGVDLSGEKLKGREFDFDVRLRELLKRRLGNFDGKSMEELECLLLERPALVKIDDLSLRPDENYGFVYQINPQAEIILDGRLKQRGSFNGTDNYGLPNFCEDGKRDFFPNLLGRLLGVYVDDDGGLYAFDDDVWSLSGSRSRVVLTDSR
ncbi:MAG: hypothetical protein ABIF88_02630 [archaeon]